MSLVIGLTGGIASGKSTVTAMFLEMGVPVIDADVEARQAVEIGEKAYEEIVHQFGPSILEETKRIDRKKLGEIIFNDEKKRKLLNSIVHPAVRERMLQKRRIAEEENAPTIVMDIPLLFESNLISLVNKTLLVYVDEEIQLERLMKRNGFTKEEALSRIFSQMPLKEKIKLSDAVIDNNGSIQDTKEQLVEILNHWKTLEP